MADTRRRQQILDFIVEFIEEHQYPPTMSEICEGVGLLSKATVKTHLGILMRDGKISAVPGKPRTIVILKEEE